MNNVPAVLGTYTAEDHRKRLENIALCEHGIKSCMRKHFVRDYIPGHCVYKANSGDLRPTAADDAAMSELKANGIGLIQIWSEWYKNTWGGKPMYQASNSEGLRGFVDLVHSHGMKIIPYTSTNFYERTDPNFRPEWAHDQKTDLVEHNYHLAHCSFASPGWRAQVLADTIRLIDEYGFDGLYNDMGYHRNCDYMEWRRYYSRKPKLVEDEIDAFEETPTHDGALQDMLGLIYAEIKRRGGVYKLHKEGFDRVHTDFRVYDYLWVGEAVLDINDLRETTKNYEPYVTPEYSRGFELKNENELYLNFIPYMQFPVSRFAQTGGKLENRKTHAYWLKHYMPMVEEGTWAWLDIGETGLTSGKLPEGVVMSAFANRDLYLVLANMGEETAKVSLRNKYASVEEAGAPARSEWNIEGHSFKIVRLKEDVE